MSQEETGKGDSWSGVSDRVSLLLDEQALHLSANDLLDRILNEQRHLILHLGKGVPAERYFERFPAIAKNDENALDVIYNEFLLERERAIAAGLPLPAHDVFLQRFPCFASALHSQFQIYQGLDSDVAMVSQPDSCDSAISRPISPDLENQTLANRFGVLEKMGEGGFAVVYKAWDQKLKRFVAIKLARFALDPESTQFQRFAREAESVARLSHPGILPIYEAGDDNGRPFIVGQLAEGGTLSRRIDDLAIPADQTAWWMLDLCEAVDYAHRLGVIHRDIKPANILFHDEFPCLSDFGLAALEESELDITMQGDLLGTPAYMSPEQARGDREITPASDVYSLGVVMYQILCRRLPFTGVPTQIIHQTLFQEPDKPRSIDRGIPLDLQTICLKAMSKKMDQRYSAREMANELRRFLDHEPIKARPVGPLGKLKRWYMRQPALAATILASTLLLVALSFTSFNRISEERDHFRNERDRANTQLFRSLVNNAESDIASKNTGWFQRAHDKLTEAARLLIPEKDPKRLRELMIKLLVDNSERFEPTDSRYFNGTVQAVAADPEQRFVVIGTEEGKLTIVGFDLKKDLAQMAGAFSRPGAETLANIKKLHVLVESSQVLALIDDQLWRWSTSLLRPGKPPLQSDAEQSDLPILNGERVSTEVLAFACSQDESMLALATTEGIKILAFDSFSGVHSTRTVEFDVGNARVECLCFSVSGHHLFIGLENTYLQCHSTVDGRLIDFQKNVRDPIRHLASWSAGILWSDSSSYSAGFWQIDSEQSGYSNRLPGAVVDVVSIGNRPLTATRDGTIQLHKWQRDNATIVARARGYGELACVSAQNNANIIFAGYADGRIQKWNLVQSNVVSEFRSHQPLSVASDGRFFDATSVVRPGNPGSPKIPTRTEPFGTCCVDVLTGDLYCVRGTGIVAKRKTDQKTQHLYDAHQSSIVDMTIDQANRLLTTVDEAGVLQIRRLNDLELTQEMSFLAGPLQQIFAHQGIVVTCGIHGVMAHDLGQTDRTSTLISDKSGQRIASDGRSIVVYGGSDQPAILEFGTWKQTASIDNQGIRIDFAVLLPADDAIHSRLFTISENRMVTIWNTETGLPIRNFEASEGANRFAVDPMGKYIITWRSATHRDKKLVDLATGKPLATFENSEQASGVLFSPDGEKVWFSGNGILEFERSRLESTYRNQSRTSMPITRFIKCDYAFSVPGPPVLHTWASDVSSDGKWYVVVGQDRTVRVKDQQTLRLHRFLTEHVDVIWSCDFSSDCRYLATGSVLDHRGEVIVWDTATWTVDKRIYLGDELISGLQFHPSLPLLAISSFDGSAWLINHESGETIQRLHEKGPRAMDIEFSPDGNFLAIARTSQGVSVWKMDSNPGGIKLLLQGNINDPGERIWTTEFTPDQKNLVTATQSGLIRFYEFPSLQPAVTIESSADGFRQMGFSADGQFLALSAWSANPGQILDLSQLRKILEEHDLNW